MEHIKILVVDEYNLFRSGVSNLLRQQADFDVIGGAGDGLAAVSQAIDLCPDIVLMSIHLPGMDGLETTRLIKQALPEVKVVMFNLDETDDDLWAAIKAGADGYLSNEIDPEGLCRALRGISQGEAAISRCIATKLLKKMARLIQDTPQDPYSYEKSIPLLSLQEKGILELVTNKHYIASQ